jgi:hypothetical protein
MMIEVNDKKMNGNLSESLYHFIFTIDLHFF